jgi:hypothetical protein
MMMTGIRPRLTMKPLMVALHGSGRIVGDTKVVQKIARRTNSFRIGGNSAATTVLPTRRLLVTARCFEQFGGWDGMATKMGGAGATGDLEFGH